VATQPFRVIPNELTRPGQCVLSVKGMITAGSAGAFQDAILASNAPALILDLSEVASIDSMAIGALVRAFVACNRTKRKLALVGLNHRVKNVLQLTGVDALFDTYATVAEAERGLS
jgi:anti-anti-sigma factor